jgi:hypothetical protein
VNCWVDELAIALKLLVVTICKCPIKPITNPKPVYSHLYHVTIFINSDKAWISITSLQTYRTTTISQRQAESGGESLKQCEKVAAWNKTSASLGKITNDSFVLPHLMSVSFIRLWGTNNGIQTLFASSSVQISELAGKCVHLNITSCRRTACVE